MASENWRRVGKIKVKSHTSPIWGQFSIFSDFELFPFYRWPRSLQVIDGGGNFQAMLLLTLVGHSSQQLIMDITQLCTQN